MRKKGQKPLPLAGILRDQIRSLGWEHKLREMAIFDDWEKVVGPHIAEHAIPLYVKEKRLAIAVESSVWAQQLAFLKRDILGKIAAVLGDGVIEDLYLTGHRIKRDDSGVREEREVFETVPLDPDTARAIDDEASRIGDAELRKAFRRLLAVASCRKRLPR